MRLTLLLLGAIGATMSLAETRLGTKFESIEVEEKGKPKTIKLTGGKGTAIIFVSANCAASNDYLPRLNVLQLDYDTKGVKFVFLDPTAGGDVEDQAKPKSWKFEVHRDPGARIAKMLDAKMTPEIFLFDQGGTFVYRGRIDDSQAEGSVTKRDARPAIDAMLDRESIQDPEVPVTAGCPIQYR